MMDLTWLERVVTPNKRLLQYLVNNDLVSLVYRITICGSSGYFVSASVIEDDSKYLSADAQKSTGPSLWSLLFRSPDAPLPLFI